MRIRPVTRQVLVTELVARIVAAAAETDRVPAGPAWVRVAVDGADAARPGELADALVEPLRASGRASVRVRAEDQLRPASLRYERGRTDPDSFYEDWLDADGLIREVLAPLDPGGDGRIRAVRWDPSLERASRSGFQPMPPGAVLLLSGPLLLGRGLPVEMNVHLEMGRPALARRTPAGLAWTLPAYDRYAAEVQPAAWADVVVRVDDPQHPAVVER